MPSRVRILRPSQFHLFEAHLLRLDAEDRMLRFGAPLSDAALASYCRALSSVDSFVIAYIEEGEVRAAAHLAFIPRFSNPAAEVGLSVERAWRRQGLGYALALRALMMAANRGLECVYLVFSESNAAMRALARKLDGSVRLEDGLVESALRVLPATPFTVWREGLDHGGGMLDFWLGLGEAAPSAAVKHKH